MASVSTGKPAREFCTCFHQRGRSQLMNRLECFSRLTRECVMVISRGGGEPHGTSSASDIGHKFVG
jgi:hypothetical protein